MVKNIEDIQIGDFVQGETQVNQVIDIEKPDLGTRLLYSFNDGPYFVTEEHPFKTEDGWKSINPKATYEEGVFNEVVTELKEGDVIITLEGKEKIKSIKWESANDQTVYNLKLSGDNTYYADGFLAHNKDYAGRDKKWYGGHTLKNELISWNAMLDSRGTDALNALENLQNAVLGGGGEEEGGELGEETMDLEHAVQDFKTAKVEAKGQRLTAGGELAGQLKKGQAELTSMIGKTNLAQAGQRQQQELQKEATQQMQEVTKTQDLSIEGAVTTMGQQQETFDVAMDTKKGEYKAKLDEVLGEFETDVEKQTYKNSFQESLNTIEDHSKYNTDNKIWSDYKATGAEGLSAIGEGNTDDAFNVSYISPEILSQENPQAELQNNPQNYMETKSIPTQKIKQVEGKSSDSAKTRGQKWFDTVRRCCFVAGTKVLMGKASV